MAVAYRGYLGAALRQAVFVMTALVVESFKALR